MRNDRRRREVKEQEYSIKNVLLIAGSILALGVIAFFVTVMVYNNNLDKIYADLDTEQIAEVTKTETNEINNPTEEASLNLGKTIEDMENETNLTSTENEEDTSSKEVTSNEVKNEVKNETSENKEEVPEEPKETEKEPTFSYPVDGEIMKEYAKDNLVYSETLQEWVTHFGIDIKAEKTSVVKSAENR